MENDILDPPVTSKGTRYVLVVVDYFTKFGNLCALHNQAAQSVAQCVFGDYVLLHSILETLHIHQDRQRLCQLLKIKKICATSYNPESVAFTYNTSVHATTKFMPYYWVHGPEAQVPVGVAAVVLVHFFHLRGAS